MELFRDGEHVRLRSSEDGGSYLHADEDGWGVSLSPHRASLNTAWAVHLLPQPQTGATFVLLHSTAYGRYLGLRPDWPPQQGPGHPVGIFRMVQCAYETPFQPDITLRVQGAEDGNWGVLVRSLDGSPLSNSPWIVEPIPPRPAPPPVPDQTPLPAYQCISTLVLLSASALLQQNGVAPPVALSRQIRYIRADNSGIFILPSRGTLQFDGRSLHFLIGDLAYKLNENFNNITLCVRAGFLGRVTPLVLNLPLSEEPMDIVVLTTGSAVATALQHPNVDAP